MSGVHPFPRFLRVSLEREGSDVIVRIAGDLDMATVEPLGDVLRAADEWRPPRILLDLHELEFVDAFGVRALARAENLLGGRLLLLRPPAQLRRVLTLAGLGPHFRFGVTPPGIGPCFEPMSDNHRPLLGDASCPDTTGAVAARPSHRPHWRPPQLGDQAVRGVRD